MPLKHFLKFEAFASHRIPQLLGTTNHLKMVGCKGGCVSRQQKNNLDQGFVGYRFVAPLQVCVDFLDQKTKQKMW